MKPFKYGEFERKVDFTDYVALERTINAQEEYQEKMGKIDEIEGITEQMKAAITAMTDLLDAVLGDNASNEILGDSITSFTQVISVYSTLDNFIIEQTKEAKEQVQNIRNKYSPKAD